MGRFAAAGFKVREGDVELVEIEALWPDQWIGAFAGQVWIAQNSGWTGALEKIARFHTVSKFSFRNVDRWLKIVRVSVIIPSYNSQSTVGAAIESALAQNVEATEIIVVDDGSTDSTVEVLKNFESSIKIVRQANAGAAAARNAGAAAARGEYLAFLDADDVWLPGRLLRGILALQNNPRAVLSFCDYILTDASGKVLDRSHADRAPLHKDLLDRAWPILPSAVTVRRSAFEKAGGFCEEFKGCGGEDPYMWLVLSEQGDFEYVSEALIMYRLGSAVSAVRKYERNRRTFNRLIGERYGALGSNLIRESGRYFAGMLLVGATEELDAGNLVGALRLIRRAHRYRPFLLFDLALAAKLCSARNLGRLTKSLLTSIALKTP